MGDDWYFQQDDYGLDALIGFSPLPKFDHGLFDQIADAVAPGWRERRAAVRREAEMLWHNQGLTHLPPEYRAGLKSLGEGLRALRGAK